MHGGRGTQWANQMQVLWNGNQGTDRHFWKGQPKATCIRWTLLSAGASSEKSWINVLWFIKANTAPSTVTWWVTAALVAWQHTYNNPFSRFTLNHSSFLPANFLLHAHGTWNMEGHSVMQAGVKMHFCRIHVLFSKIKDLLFQFVLIIILFVFFFVLLLLVLLPLVFSVFYKYF